MDAGKTKADADTGAPPPCSKDLFKDPKNCGRCGNDCKGKTCNDGVCEGDDDSKTLGDIRQIVAGGDFIYVAQADGIYRSEKGSRFVTGKKISALADARLAVDAVKLYAVGKKGGVTEVAVCSLPCGADWSVLTESFSDAPTSVVVAHGQPFFVGLNKLWKFTTIGPEEMAVDDLDESRGSRVHADDVSLYWTGAVKNFIQLENVTSAPFASKKWDCSTSEVPCNTGVADVLVLNAEKAFGNTDEYRAFGVVVTATKMLARCYTSGCSATSLGIEGIEALAHAENGDANGFYARALDGIHLCSAVAPNAPYGVSLKCAPVVSSSPAEPIVSMVVDGEALYYAVVKNRGTSDVQGTIVLEQAVKSEAN